MKKSMDRNFRKNSLFFCSFSIVTNHYVPALAILPDWARGFGNNIATNLQMEDTYSSKITRKCLYKMVFENNHHETVGVKRNAFATCVFFTIT